jgi:BASS family bile acid:Na+ symporter
MTVGLLVYGIVPVTVIVLMTAVGLHLSLSAVREILERPRSLAIGTLLQVVLLPAAALTLIAVFGPQPLIALVILAISVSPGGALSNVFTHLVGGNLALSVLMTTVTTLLVAAVAPLVLAIASASGLLEAEVAEMLDPVSVAVDLFRLALLPICVGLVVAHSFPRALPGLRRFADRLSLLAIAILFTSSVVVSWPVLGKAAAETLVHAAMFSLASLGIGAAASRLLVPEDRSACVIEFAVRNLVIALVLATGSAPSEEVVAFLLAYFILNTGLLFAVSFLRKARGARALV